MISAQVITDSKNEFSNRITTMVVTFPRFILAELNTHRMFSRNSASSRAIPFEKMVKSVQENPFIPIALQKDHKGMQGTEYFTDWESISMSGLDWLTARDNAVNEAKNLAGRGVTKQLCNRLLEPFMWHTVIITATEWENFFALRCPKYKVVDGLNGVNAGLTYYRSWKDLVKKEALGLTTKQFLENMSLLERLQKNSGQAEIHMMALAEAMWDAYNESTPKELKAGEWHIPFGDQIDSHICMDISGDRYTFNEMKVMIATARCARVSYTVVGEEGKEPNYENDIKLHDRLAQSGHWSPFEHCAKAMEYLNMPSNNFSEWSGNFRGFIQYRKMFVNENLVKNGR